MESEQRIEHKQPLWCVSLAVLTFGTVLTAAHLSASSFMTQLRLEKERNGEKRNEESGSDSKDAVVHPDRVEHFLTSHHITRVGVEDAGLAATNNFVGQSSTWFLGLQRNTAALVGNECRRTATPVASEAKHSLR